MREWRVKRALTQKAILYGATISSCTDYPWTSNQ
jgi:hypothetical protein